ncbi:MAG: YncE family protein [Candidatus Dependentiae bacterium]|nr:YncE family protein [Candidatus Dependentiae bacterium]
MRRLCLTGIIVTTFLVKTIISNSAYVGNFNNGTVSIFNTTTDTVTGVVSDPYGSINSADFIAIAPNGLAAYVVNRFNNTISIIDTIANTVIGVMSSVHFNGIYAIYITPDGKKMYATNVGNNTISIINLATNTVTGLINDIIHPFQGPYYMALNCDGTTAYVGNYTDKSVAIVNVTTDTVTGLVSDLGNTFNGPFALNITPSGAELYVGNYDNGTISIVNVFTNQVVGLVQDPLSSFGFISYIVSFGSAAYVDNFFGSNTISVINIPTNIVVDIISNPSFDAIYYLAVSATPKGTKIYVPSYFSSTVAIIDAATNSVKGFVLDPINTFNGTYSIAIMPSPQPPTSLVGVQVANIFLTQTDIINKISWDAPNSGPAPVSYKIYRDVTLSDLAGTVSASGILQFEDHNRQSNKSYTYYIVTIDQFSSSSFPGIVTVAPIVRS